MSGLFTLGLTMVLLLFPFCTLDLALPLVGIGSILLYSSLIPIIEELKD